MVSSSIIHSNHFHWHALMDVCVFVTPCTFFVGRVCHVSCNFAVRFCPFISHLWFIFESSFACDLFHHHFVIIMSSYFSVWLFSSILWIFVADCLLWFAFASVHFYSRLVFLLLLIFDFWQHSIRFSWTLMYLYFI